MNSESHCNGFNPFQLMSQQKSYPTYYDYIVDVGKQVDQDKAFYTYDLADILWKAQLWKERFPNVVPYYAVKANADPVIIRLFVLLGYGFDCSTQGEIQLVLDSKADPKNIIFAHTIKLPKGLKYAASVGVDLMTFDGREELDKIHEYFPSARLILRLKSETPQKVYNLSKKFGCTVKESKDLLLHAKALKLEVVGVSFHVGGLCEDPRTFTSTIEDARSVFDIAERLGFHFTVMNIGAGFFGSKQREPYFYKLSEEINKSLEKNFPEVDVEFMAEPGCYYVASAVTVTTSIIGKRLLLDSQNGLQREYFLNESYYGTFFNHNDIYDVSPHPVLSSEERQKRANYNSRVWGQTCCSEDILREECLLPDMKNGEHIVWSNVGAYSEGVFSNFTLIPTPAKRYVFVNNNRLRTDWITNAKEVAEFIKNTAIFIENETI